MSSAGNVSQEICTAGVSEMPFIISINNNTSSVENASFHTICGTCHEVIHGNDINYVPLRENLRTFLSKSFQGLEILAYYEF